MAEKGVLSAKGERVDFDLLKIKQQIASAPKATTVKAREDFVDRKFKRRLKRQTQELVDRVNALVIPDEPVEELFEEEIHESEELEITPPTKSKES